jgi:hypothetical protein
MGSRWASRTWPPCAAALLVGLAWGRPAAAQQGREVGLTAIATASDPASIVGGVYAALRTSLRTRVSAAAAIGGSDGQTAWRGELLAHFLLSPTRRDGVGLYGAGGVAVVGGPVNQGYLVVTLGLEGRPGAAAGWFVEGGLGGGARLAAGYRWRHLPGGWPGP